MLIIGFDPGKDKCGVAVMDEKKIIYTHAVIPSPEALNGITALLQKYPSQTLVMGNQTTSKSWKKQLQENLPPEIEIILVDERNSSQEARDRYWEMYPPKGVKKLIPRGMLVPDCPIDDIVAILLIERYLQQVS
ncbi:MAG: putative pre-16S rRNA nuclease [Chroococcopsis gigantea SAG 12.99]|jgi:RNase H-fold protein (predicted Holliday junction resolvase)|nr:putative pre-16S rRNA nuclease [Chroococcopsis gigantea SAG 12.99]